MEYSETATAHQRAASCGVLRFKIKYDDRWILPMIASSKLDNAKMSVDMQKDIEKLRSGQA
jgi:hypothetical protein